MASADVPQPLSSTDLLCLWEPVLDHVSDGVVVADARRADPPILWVNRAFERLTGYTASEVQGRSCCWLQGKDRAQPAAARIRSAIAERREAQEVLRHYRKDGESFWSETTVSPIRDPEGEIVLVLYVLRDVTPERRAERERRRHRRLQEQLRRTNEALATTVQELARRNLQMLALNETVDHLQGCATWSEAESALEECVPEIFPQEAGGLYLVNRQRTAVEPLVVWGDPAPPDRAFAVDECQALRRRRDFWTDASHPADRCRHYEPQPGIAELCLSLRSQNRALGVLHLRVAIGDEVETGQDLRASVLRFAVNAAEQIALTLANIQLRQTLHTQAIQDPLTGLYNRRFFNDALGRELRRAARRDTPLALMMIDLDHFKRVNDEMGHEAGDRLLCALAEMLRDSVRAEDVIARYGGEEFMVLLPETALADAVGLAERLRVQFRERVVPRTGPSPGTTTLSVGVAARPESGTTVESLIQSADTALYRAKREGRDRVVASPSVLPSS